MVGGTNNWDLLSHSLSEASRSALAYSYSFILAIKASKHLSSLIEFCFCVLHVLVLREVSERKRFVTS